MLLAAFWPDAGRDLRAYDLLKGDDTAEVMGKKGEGKTKSRAVCPCGDSNWSANHETGRLFSRAPDFPRFLRWVLPRAWAQRGGAWRNDAPPSAFCIIVEGIPRLRREGKT